jgi:hypothetical protein
MTIVPAEHRLSPGLLSPLPIMLLRAHGLANALPQRKGHRPVTLLGAWWAGGPGPRNSGGLKSDRQNGIAGS